MKTLLILSFIALQGCASMLPGRADYTVRPFTLENGKVICCEATVSNSKDIGKIEVEFTADGKGALTFRLVEQDVNSSTPNAVAAETTSKALDALVKALDRIN